MWVGVYDKAMDQLTIHYLDPRRARWFYNAVIRNLATKIYFQCEVKD